MTWALNKIIRDVYSGQMVATVHKADNNQSI